MPAASSAGMRCDGLRPEGKPRALVKKSTRLKRGKSPPLIDSADGPLRASVANELTATKAGIGLEHPPDNCAAEGPKKIDEHVISAERGRRGPTRGGEEEGDAHLRKFNQVPPFGTMLLYTGTRRLMRQKPQISQQE